MKTLLPFLILTLGFASCNRSKQNKKTLDFGAFTIVTPQGWAKIKGHGQDSYVGRIQIDSYDTLYFDLGWYSDDLSEFQKLEMSDGKIYYANISDTSKNIKLLDSTEIDKLKKSMVTWDIIDGRKAKILKPIKSGLGVTGIYIDSLWKTGDEYDRFNLFGTNMKPENEQAFLLSIKTLKFKEK